MANILSNMLQINHLPWFLHQDLSHIIFLSLTVIKFQLQMLQFSPSTYLKSNFNTSHGDNFNKNIIDKD